MIAVKTQSSAPAFVLASMVASYPDELFAENLSTLLDDKELHSGLGISAQKSLTELCTKLEAMMGDPVQLNDLRSEFIDLFDRGKDVTSLYETEYGRDRAMVKGNELSDIAGFYRAFGFEAGGDEVQAEMIDHVAVELEFYALLVFKYEALVEAGDNEGVEIVLDARCKFLKDHLGRFIGSLSDRPGLLESKFYLNAMQYCRDLVFDECKKLNLSLDQAQWLSGQVEPPDMECGGSVGCLK